MTEKIKLPQEVVNADWKDDVDYETFGDNKQEMEYVSPDDISKDSIERIKAIDLKPLFKNRGKKIINIFSNAA